VTETIVQPDLVELETEKDARSEPSVLLWLQESVGRRGDLATRVLVLLLVVYIAKQVVTALIFPPFTGHDEVAHFNYIQTVATEQRVPVLLEDQLPDYFYRYCRYILDWSPCEPDNPRWLEQPFRFADWGASGVYPAGMQYVANHSPLYYMIMAPFFAASDHLSPETQQYILRLLAIPFGVLIVVLAFLSVRTIFPAETFLAITVPAFVAFQPQISYEAAMVNNDILGIAGLSLVLYLLLRGIRDRFPLRVSALLGVALGLALLAKSTSVTAIPVIALAIIATVGIRNWRAWIASGSIVAAIAGVIVAPWYVFLYRTYGNIDGFDQIMQLQEPWNQPSGGFFDLLFNRGFIWWRWRETWGEFGWRRIPLDSALLWAIAIPCIVALVGLMIYAVSAWRLRRDEAGQHRLGTFASPSRMQVIALLVLLVTCVIAYLAIIEFGTRFVLTQARYYFPAVIAVAILLMVGLRALTPVRLIPAVQSGVIVGLFLMNVVIYSKYVIPYWHLTDWSAVP
jgi:4-amino-4-deoxy-L-arabinose transferase-like glycosyltransferase